ncbi:MAG: hypothetical protein EPO00_02450 [Chloroflexota bacterium]|nr:MAG: hypothetical protein EPO00_02450 [Chloroflexota bacterium]
MDQPTLIVFAVAAVIGLLASLVILRRRDQPDESPFATSTEGMKRCPNCGMANIVTDTTCASCGQTLPG